MRKAVLSNRVITDSDINRYEPMIAYFIRKFLFHSFPYVEMRSPGKDVTIGNTGWSIDDFKQHMRLELFLALKKYEPTRGYKESTWVYQVLRNRCVNRVKVMTRPCNGYNTSFTPLESLTNYDGYVFQDS